MRPPPGRRPLKTALRIALSLAVAAVLLAVLMVWGEVRPRDVLETVRRLPLGTLGLAVGVHAGIYALRAWRFRVLVPPGARPGYGRALVVSAAHNLAAYVLPAKTGEAAFVVYLKTVAGVSGARGLASLVVSRILDLAVLCALLAAACARIAAGGAGTLGAPAVLLAALAIFFGLLALRSHAVVPVAERIARALRIDRTGLGTRLLARSREVGEALASAGGDRRVLGAGLLSVPIWLGVFLFYAVLARGMGLAGVGLPELTFGSSVAVLFNLLPVNGLAGFGTQEAGWTFGFGLVGVDPDLALATGIGAHFVQLLDVCLFGVAGHLVMGALGTRRPAGERVD